MIWETCGAGEAKFTSTTDAQAGPAATRTAAPKVAARIESFATVVPLLRLSYRRTIEAWRCDSLDRRVALPNSGRFPGLVGSAPGFSALASGGGQGVRLTAVGPSRFPATFPSMNAATY